MKAVLKNGVIEPQESLPEDWQEGTELEVEKVDSSSAHSDAKDLDKWYAELEAACSEMDPEDEVILEKAIREVRQRARDLAREEADKSNGVPSPADWLDDVERSAAQQEPGDDDRLQQAIDEERRLAKEMARNGKW